MRTLRALVPAFVVIGFAGPALASPTKPTYEEDIKPIFKEHCVSCHSPEKKKGDFDLSTFNAMMSGGGSGDAVKAGKGDASLLYKTIAHLEEPYMPPKKPKLPAATLELVKKWIDDGAPESIKITYEDHIKPIFREHCANCHSADKREADLDVMSFAGIMAGSSTGDVVYSGAPDDSKLYLTIAHKAEPFMPRNKAKLPEAQIELVAAWIRGGLLEKSTSKALATKPKVSLALDPAKLGKPDGPPPMPAGEMLMDPMVTAARGNPVTALAHNPWSPLLAIGSQRQVTLYHSETGEFLGVLPFPEGEPEALSFSRNGQYLLVGGGYGAKVGLAALFDIRSGQRIATVGDEFDSVLAADMTPDLKLVAVGGPNRLVKIYSVETGELKHTIKKHTDWVLAVAVSPDGKFLVTGDRNGGVHMWETASAQPVFDLTGHRGAITAITWRADSRLVATASLDGTVRVWDAKTGESTKTLSNAHGGGVTAVRYGMDGRLVTAGKDKLVKVWDVEARPVKTLSGLPDQAFSAALSHDGKRAFGGDFAGNVFGYDVDKAAKLREFASNPPALAEQIKQQRELIAKLKSETQQAATAKPALQAEIKKLSDELAAAEKRQKELPAQLATANGKVPALEKQVKQLEGELASLRDAAGKITDPAKKAEHQKKIESKAAALKAASEDLKFNRNVVKNAKPEGEALTKAVTGYTTKLEDLKARLAKLDALSSELPAAEARVIALEAAQPFARLYKARLQLDELKAEFQRATEAAASARQAVDAATASIADTQTVAAAAPKLLKQKQAEYDKAAAAANSAKVSLGGIVDAQEKAESELRAAQKTLDEAKAKAAKNSMDAALAEAVKQAEAPIEGLKKKLEQVSTEAAAKMKEYNDLTAAAAAVKEELAAAQTAVDETPKQVEAAKTAIARAKADADAAEKAAAQAQTLIASAEKQVAELAKAYEASRPAKKAEAPKKAAKK